jgi:hypothetical protein
MSDKNLKLNTDVALCGSPPIMSPEVEASMRETAHQRAKRGMLAVALVTPADSGLSIVSYN